MEQQKSSMMVPLLLVAVLVAGGYFFYMKSAEKKDGLNPALTKEQGTPAPAATTNEPVAALPTGNVDDAAAAILSGALSADEIISGEGSDNALVISDETDINSYGDSYDTTDF
jgi:hypothetical protein